MALNKDNMDETVKTTQDAVTETEVKTEEVVASTTEDTGVDLAETLVDALDKLAKAETDRDNYKKGMLKYKGKLDEDGDDNDGVTKESKTTETTTSPEVVTLLKQVIRENKELRTARANTAQIASSAQGSGSETKTVVGDNLLSAEQLQSLKTKGWDDAKIARFKANLLKVRS